MAGGEWVVTAVGGRAPDFVPAWVEVLIVVLGFVLAAIAIRRRNKR